MLFPHQPFPEIERPWFVAGVNDHVLGVEGSDIGPNPILRRPTSFNAEARLQLERDFARFRAWGLKVVRIWAMEHGEGLRWSDSQLFPLVTGLDPTFLANIGAVSRLARQHQLRIYWTLLASADFEPIVRVEPPADDSPRARSAYQRRRDQARMRSGFFHMLRDPGARDSFFEHAVGPFVEGLRDCRGGVFAIDLMNEPDMLWPTSMRNLLEALMRQFVPAGGWLARQLPGLRALDQVPDRALELVLRSALQALRDELPPALAPMVETWLQARARNQFYESQITDFLAAMARFIRDGCRPHPPLSTGFGFANSILRYHATFDDLFDFWDFHHYNTMDIGNRRIFLEPFSQLGLSKPCLLGECGLGGQLQSATLGASIDDSFHLGRPVTVRDVFDRQASCVESYLDLTSSRGYGGCIVWDYEGQLHVVRNLPLRLTTAARDIPRVRGASCPPARGGREGDCGWGLRYPLVWRQADSDALSNRYCFHAPGEPTCAGRLCGRPAAASLYDFTLGQRRQGRLPP